MQFWQFLSWGITQARSGPTHLQPLGSLAPMVSDGTHCSPGDSGGMFEVNLFVPAAKGAEARLTFFLSDCSCVMNPVAASPEHHSSIVTLSDIRVYALKSLPTLISPCTCISDTHFRLLM